MQALESFLQLDSGKKTKTLADLPLVELEESWVFGMLWPKRLLVFEDRIETRGVELLRETVEVIRYTEIETAVVGGGGWSASLLIKLRTGKPVLIRGIEEDAARHAGAMIEERVKRATNNSKLPHEPSDIPDSQALIRKLSELRDAGVLTREEFELKRKKLEEN